MIGSSAGWGVAKPDPAFYARVVAETGCAASEVAYVGDRIDNDVLPARAAGPSRSIFDAGHGDISSPEPSGRTSGLTPWRSFRRL